jgi:hypothetical protein
MCGGQPPLRLARPPSIRMHRTAGASQVWAGPTTEPPLWVGGSNPQRGLRRKGEPAASTDLPVIESAARIIHNSNYNKLAACLTAARPGDRPAGGCRRCDCAGCGVTTQGPREQAPVLSAVLEPSISLPHAHRRAGLVIG